MPKPKQASRGRPVFKPICTEQKEAYKLLKESTITFLTGPAGSTKSYTAMAYAIDRLLDDDGGIDNIVLTRPAVEACGEELGYMPGTAQEKLGPYIHPMLQHLKDYAYDQRDQIRSAIDVVPLAHARGRNFHHAIAIMDEAQNANDKQFEMFLTRIGHGSKLIICGDPNQSDIYDSPLMDIASQLCKEDGIAHFHFSSKASVCRHPIIPTIITYFEGRKHGRSSGVSGRH